MGDSSKLYVSRLLTDVKLTNIDCLRRALHLLHTVHSVENVVISSWPMSSELHAQLPENIRASALGTSLVASPTPNDYIIAICSSFPSGGKAPSLHAILLPKVSGYFSGVGDLFSALVLGHYQRHRPEPLAEATLLALQ